MLLTFKKSVPFRGYPCSDCFGDAYFMFMLQNPMEESPYERELEKLATKLGLPKPTYKINQRTPTNSKPRYSAVVYVSIQVRWM